MNLAVIGSGYVGLVSGTCFAEMGNKVICVDIDEDKIQQLKKGIIPIYEPGLSPMVLKNIKNENLQFSTSLKESIQNASVIFIAVGTPIGDDGSADLKHVISVAKEIGQYITREVVIVDKSTVPVGTADKVKETIQLELDNRGLKLVFHVVSNPEFLKEGDAINDFMKPDRVVIGSRSQGHKRDPKNSILLVIGKTDDKNLGQLIEKYQQRLNHYINFEIEIIP